MEEIAILSIEILRCFLTLITRKFSCQLVLHFIQILIRLLVRKLVETVLLEDVRLPVRIIMAMDLD